MTIAVCTELIANSVIIGEFIGKYRAAEVFGTLPIIVTLMFRRLFGGIEAMLFPFIVMIVGFSAFLGTQKLIFNLDQNFIYQTIKIHHNRQTRFVGVHNFSKLYQNVEAGIIVTDKKGIQH